jgi:coatomer subunit beta
MDYISPATCADVAFQNMWAEFEWENKVIDLYSDFLFVF